MENKVGIYCFENTLDGKKYIGKSKNIKYRTRQHIYDLRKGHDESCILQNAWSKHGEEYFKIYIVEECSIELLNEKEIYWIRELHSHKSENGYNVTWGGDCSPMEGRHHTKETIQRLSETKIGENNYWFGKHHSDETKEKMSKNHIGMTGYFHTDESKYKTSVSTMGEKNHNFGKNFSKDHKQKISDSKIGLKTSKNPSSQYVGVTKNARLNKWKSTIYPAGESYHLGYFDFEVEAALAYNQAALEFYGWKAKINIITQEEINDLWEKD